MMSTLLDKIAEMPLHGAMGRLSAAGDRLQCHLCGRFYVSLAAHVVQRHGMRADEYRETFGLNATTALVGPSLRAIRRATGRRVLTPYQDHHRFANLSSEERSTQVRGREVRLETRRALAAAKQRQVAVVCAICGQTFTLKASRARRPERHTCSLDCRRELLRRDGIQAANSETSRENRARGNAVRWERRKTTIAARLQTLGGGTLDTLPARDRQIVDRYYGFGGDAQQTQSEIARSLGVDPKTVHRRLRAVVVRLLGPDAFTS